MKAVDQKALTIRSQEIGDRFATLANALRDGNFGVAYACIFAVKNELNKIEFEVVKELGAIEERTK